MDVSAVCRSFIEHASALRWRDAVVTLNGLTMYEMLRALKALDATDIAAFNNALAGVRPSVNAPRMEYALAVVQTHRVPATAPAGLPPDQIADARAWLRPQTSILEEYVPKSRLPAFNIGLTAANNAQMFEVFGAPRNDYTDSDQPITNPALRHRIVVSHAGRLGVRGLNSAVASLQTVMSAVQQQQRLVYRVLESNGMLSVRYVRGSTTHISNHSWGTAIDLIVAGTPDIRGDNQVLFGLLLIAPIFNAHGWYWGAGFPTEDGMHFEAGQALIRGWKGVP